MWKRFFPVRVVRQQEKLWISVPGSGQGQVGWGFEQPCLVGDAPVSDRGVRTR